jgi:multidrug resistance efflux pump
MNTRPTLDTVIKIPPRRRYLMFCREWLPIGLFAIGVGVVLVAWPRVARPASLVAEAERVEAVLKSTQAGRLIAVEARQFQTVKAGDILARVAVAEPALIEASLAKIRAEIAYLRASRSAVLDTERAQVDAQRLQLDWLRERVSLATQRMQLQEVESAFARVDALYGKKLIAEDEHERARLQRETLRQQIAEQTRLVDTLAPALENTAVAVVENNDKALCAAVAAQEEELRVTEAQLAEVVLRAPIDGVVTVVYRLAGENLAAAEPVLSLAAASATHLVGFVRPPATRKTRPGMRVELRTRDSPRLTFDAEIVNVGVLLEPITATLLTAVPTNPRAVEVGLRVQIAKPAALSLRPGEQVDVLIRDES